MEFRVATSRIISTGSPGAAASGGGAACLPGIRGLCNWACTKCRSFAGRRVRHPPACTLPSACGYPGKRDRNRRMQASMPGRPPFLSKLPAEIGFVALQQRIATHRDVAEMSAANLSATGVAFRRFAAVARCPSPDVPRGPAGRARFEAARDAGAGPVIVGGCRHPARHADGARSGESEGAGSPG